MHSFLTGSRVYGKPRPDSDIDLCTLVSYRDMREIMSATQHDHTGSAMPHSISLKFGQLNLILTCDPRCFAEWQMATRDLWDARPVSLEDAIKHFQKIEAFRVVEKSPEAVEVSI